MKLSSFLALAMTAGVTSACGGSSTDDAGESEDALIIAPEPVAPSYAASKLERAVELRYNTPSSSVRRRSLLKVPTFELEGTPGDEVEIRVTARVAGENPSLVVLGSPDPTALAQCAKRSALSQPWCYEAVPSPVLASNDDADGTTKNPKLRVKLTGPRLRLGVLGARVFDVVVDTVASGIDPDACQRSVRLPSAGEKGSFDRVRLTRDCKDAGGRDCTPWRELDRSQGRNRAYVGAGDRRKVILQNDGGTYTWIKCSYRDCGTRVSEACLANTPCTISGAGDVTCDDWHDASVTYNRRTALDADTCDALRRPATFSGVIGDACLSLSTGIERTRTTAGSTETQTVIVTTW